MLYPTELWAARRFKKRKQRTNEKRAVIDSPFKLGRSTRIRTLDPLVPNQVRYRTAPHSEDQNNTRLGRGGQMEKGFLLIF